MVEDEMTLVIIHQDYTSGISGSSLFCWLFFTAVALLASITKNLSITCTEFIAGSTKNDIYEVAHNGKL
jgi:hypothetical protein